MCAQPFDRHNRWRQLSGHLRIGDVGVVNSIAEDRRPKCLLNLPVKTGKSHGAGLPIHRADHQSPAPEPGGNRPHLLGGRAEAGRELLGRQPSMIRRRVAVLNISFELRQLRAVVQRHYHLKLQQLTVRQFADNAALLTWSPTIGRTLAPSRSRHKPPAPRSSKRFVSRTDCRSWVVGGFE